MDIVWQQNAWDDYYIGKKRTNKKSKRINGLIKDCQRNSFSGIDKPELIKGIYPVYGQENW